MSLVQFEYCQIGLSEKDMNTALKENYYDKGYEILQVIQTFLIRNIAPTMMVGQNQVASGPTAEPVLGIFYKIPDDKVEEYLQGVK